MPVVFLARFLHPPIARGPSLSSTTCFSTLFASATPKKQMDAFRTMLEAWEEQQPKRRRVEDPVPEALGGSLELARRHKDVEWELRLGSLRERRFVSGIRQEAFRGLLSSLRDDPRFRLDEGFAVFVHHRDGTRAEHRADTVAHIRKTPLMKRQFRFGEQWLRVAVSREQPREPRGPEKAAAVHARRRWTFTPGDQPWWQYMLSERRVAGDGEDPAWSSEEKRLLDAVAPAARFAPPSLEVELELLLPLAPEGDNLAQQAVAHCRRLMLED